MTPPAPEGKQAFAPDPAALSGMLRWRCIGPARGGRTIAVTGVPGRPNEFYVAAVNGGIFKTTDAGHTWTPIFDDQPTASIGALAVAPSAPDTIYAGSGEGRLRPDLSIGNGIYKSTDAGAHWTHLGLPDAQQIPKIVVDPKDANRLFVAVLGHPYGPNEERGVYRSTDGGATFERVLYQDENSGAFDLALDPSDPNTLYATLYAARQPAWEAPGDSGLTGKGTSGLFKSTDGGTTWNQIDGGWPKTPADGLWRMAVALAPSDPKRVYVYVSSANNIGAGVYRSDDAGATWALVNATERIFERGTDLATLAVDPRDAGVVYLTNVSLYKSSDGGKTFTVLRGGPGGEDYQNIWIAPDDPRTIVVGVDQGAAITVNGGQTWSSWYNQPTAQFYHVITDDAFPYRVYGAQQESGSARVLSRGNNGAITLRDWQPVGSYETAYVAPDPRNRHIVFSGAHGWVWRYDDRSGQIRHVGPNANGTQSAQIPSRRTTPLAFSPADPHRLYVGGDKVYESTDDEHVSWREISPVLARPSTVAPPKSTGVYADTPSAKPRGGVVYALGLSPCDADVIWAGTDDGLVWRTTDRGKHWTDVTPKGVTAWAKISVIDASPFDKQSAYVAVNRFRLDEQRPQLFRTHDGGASWRQIDNGIESAPTNVVRADPKRRGLLYAGTERGVWASFDDGDSWTSLRLNLPATSVRDLVVHGDDLVIATHGRGFWIIDDITPLRHVESLASTRPTLLPPARAWRVQRDTNTDMPLQPEEPFFVNAPNGAALDYVLPATATSVGLTIRDDRGNVVRRYPNDDQPPPPPDTCDYDAAEWLAPPASLEANAGAHRFVWNLQGPPPRAFGAFPSFGGIPHATPLWPEGATVPPGTYTVTLEVDGVEQASEKLVVEQDPRVPVKPADLAEQYALALQIVQQTNLAYDASVKVQTSNPDLSSQLNDANQNLWNLLVSVEIGDGKPTEAQRAVFKSQSAALEALLKQVP